MTTRSLTVAALAAFASLTAHLSAAPTASLGYTISLLYAHPGADRIVSYDWAGASDLYFETATPGYNYGGFFQWSGGAPVTLQSGSPTAYAGASVVTIGDFVYFNVDPGLGSVLRRFGPLSGAPAVAQISATANYALHGQAGDLFITGATAFFGPNEIFHSDLDANGNLLSNPAVSLGVTGGGSGPLAWDAAGNLFFAPGYGDKSIYRWTAADLADAIADPVADPLTLTGHLWASYAAAFPSQTGATSMLIAPDGDVLLTITDFAAPSFLTRFDAALDGTATGLTENILTDPTLLGELRTHAGGLYVSSENAIYQVIPEPASLALLSVVAAGLLARRRR